MTPQFDPNATFYVHTGNAHPPPRTGPGHVSCDTTVPKELGWTCAWLRQASRYVTCCVAVCGMRVVRQDVACVWFGTAWHVRMVLQYVACVLCGSTWRANGLAVRLMCIV